MTTHQDTSTEREVLKACPFCGKTHTAKIIRAQELAEQDSDYDDEFWPHSDSFAVICDASIPNGPGGCGASGGFFPTEAEAVAAWQRRAALASRDEAAQQPQGQAVSDEAIVAMAFRTCWQYRRSTDPHHSDTYKFNTTLLLRFVRSILALRDKPLQVIQSKDDSTPNNAI
jgi:hypothetical protein